MGKLLQAAELRYQQHKLSSALKNTAQSKDRYATFLHISVWLIDRLILLYKHRGKMSLHVALVFLGLGSVHRCARLTTKTDISYQHMQPLSHIHWQAPMLQYCDFCFHWKLQYEITGCCLSQHYRNPYVTGWALMASAHHHVLYWAGLIYTWTF